MAVRSDYSPAAPSARRFPVLGRTPSKHSEPAGATRKRRNAAGTCTATYAAGYKGAMQQAQQGANMENVNKAYKMLTGQYQMAA